MRDWLWTRYVRPVRRRVRGIERLLRLERPLRALEHRSADAPITERELGRLRHSWGNPGYEADLDYLRLVCEHAISARFPVLECGSGLTTVLLAVTAARRGVDVWSLEHDLGWYRATRRVLVHFGLRGIHLVHAPLVRHEGYSWYDAPLSLMPDRFGLVVCDGPPGSTLGGRGGLMHVMRDRLRGAIILIDDAERPSERAMLSDWGKRWAIVARIATSQAGSQVATVMVPDAPTHEEEHLEGRRPIDGVNDA
jgi:hypothetical protein